MNRRTLQATTNLNGMGLFTQALCDISIEPAEAGEGITLWSTDAHGESVAAHICNLSTKPVHPAFKELPPRNTCLFAHGASFVTVEHVLSALAGLGITDTRIVMNSPEVPIFDGSARAFVEAISQSGTVELDSAINPIVVNEPITVRSDDSWITAEPNAEGWSYTYELDYGEDALIAPQSATWNGEEDTYRTQVAPARTFSLEHEAKAMQSVGLFTAFTPADLLVIGEDGPIDNAWRFDNEPARHKLLDLVGDLSLAGAPICAKITAHRSGHALNHEMATHLASLSPSQ